MGEQLSFLESPGKNPGEPRKTDLRGSFFLKVEPRNPGTPGTPARSPGFPGRGFQGPGSHLKETPTPGNLNLIERRKSLENEIEKTEAEYAQANAAQQPFKQAFDEATLEVHRLHRLRKGGVTVPKRTMLDAYDWRVVTGHEWHPHRSKAEDLACCLEALREELKAVNREIGG